LITITRRLALQLRVVFRRALGLTRVFGPALWFATGRDGIHVRARSGGAAVEYHDPSEKLPTEDMWLPFDFLDDVEARRDDPVELEARPDGHIMAGWRDGNVPQCVRYDPVKPSDTDRFPEMPKKFTQNPPRLLVALRDAMETTDPDAVRFATNTIQLRGTSGTIAATDGRQVLIQHGFTFPWDDDVLMPRTRVFGSRELFCDGPVALARTGVWVVIRNGPWTVHRTIDTDGRFPEVDHHVPRAGDAAARLWIAPTNAESLAKSLPRLPGYDEFNGPVTVDLNGTVAIRARAEMQKEPTELTLCDSTCSGEPIRINTSRKYLARAVKLGFEEIHLYTPKVPVMCRDEHRRYVWALLGPDSAIPPSEGAIRITSAELQDEKPANVSISNHKPRRRRPKAMSQRKPDQDGRTEAASRTRPAAGDKTGTLDLEALIEHAEVLRGSLREALSKTSELVAALKRHRRQSKLVQSTLASLKRLQAADA